jgi:short-subunit dehydrogenase
MSTARPLAVVTGASSGIGLELARCFAEGGFDLLLAADTPLDQARAIEGATVEAYQLDLATEDGVRRLYQAIGSRPVAALAANAGIGLGGAFLDQDTTEWRKVVDTNVVGTLLLVQLVGRDMRARGEGRILVTSSIASVMPGTFNAVYNGTKAFVQSFSHALREELRDTGVTVTALLPGATETEFFARADMLDTKVGQDEKDDPADVAKTGYDALMKGRSDVVYGFKNKMQVAASNVLSEDALAKRHRGMAEPGSAQE